MLKVKDKYASVVDVTKKDKSVVSGLTIEDMSVNSAAKKWQSNRNLKKTGQPKEEKNNYNALLEKGIKETMPAQVSPMNCTLIKEIFNNEHWLYEIKLDGYRIVSFLNNGIARLQSRGGLNYTSKYPKVIAGLKKLSFNGVLDGDVVAVDETGNISFDKLQKVDDNTSLVYYVFDLLWLDGYDLKRLPLVERKSILRQILPDSDVIKYANHFEDADGLWEQIRERELEGIVAKRKDSIYQENYRSQDWLKLPTKKRQEFVIGGWAESERGRSFRSLLFGAYNNKGQLEWIGRSGGGYKEKDMPGILRQLKALEIKESPFVNKILDTKGAIIHYVKPQLVANFGFATWTTSGRIRKPATFLGFRNDKDAKNVVREKPLTEKEEANLNKDVSPDRTAGREAKVTMEDSNWPLLENEAITSEDFFTIEGKDVRLTNVEREVWTGIPKAALIQYYHSVAGYILPHLKDRPLSLHIKNINAGAPGLYIKDMEGLHYLLLLARIRKKANVK